MNIKLKLTVLNFLQYFVWGAWLITMATFWFDTKQWGGAEFGVIFSTMGIASIFMPTLIGIVADRWINAEKLYGILQIAYAGTLFYLPHASDPTAFFWVMLVAMVFYMPTIALSNSINYHILKEHHYDVVKVFPSLRVWGTVGFIAAMWVTNLTGNKASENQFYIAAIVAVLLGIYAFTLPKCPPQNLIAAPKNIENKKNNAIL